MSNELMIVMNQRKIIIRNCIEKLSHFCQFDAFPNYDLIGYRYLKQSNIFQKELLKAMNKAMRARSSRKAWSIFIDRPLSELANIPLTVDLIESPEDDCLKAIEALSQCFIVLTSVSGITDMASTKMLYLKRPRLVAISDSYVRKTMGIKDPDLSIYRSREAFFTQRAISVAKAVRTVGRENMELLDSLQRKISPIEVTKARIVDILIWVDMAISEMHPQWNLAAKTKGWDQV